MPLDDCCFRPYPTNNLLKPLLPIKVINPHTGQSHLTLALIDTGADDCALPAEIAVMLGHNLTAGAVSDITTGSGSDFAYKHTTTIEIFHPQRRTKRPVYVIENVVIDYMERLTVPLLGTKGFLSKFILNIDYTRLRFSIKFPEVDPRDGI